MCKLSLVLGLVLVVLVVESSCQRIILPTYRPPPQPRQPIIRTARDTSRDEPLWLYKGDDVIRAPATGDHPVLPSIIDDVNFGPTRHARSLSTPGRGRIGSNDRGNQGSRGHDTGATHPGHNRRNARSLNLPDFVTTPPFNPKPWTGFPQPQRPRDDTGASQSGHNRHSRSLKLPNWLKLPQPQKLLKKPRKPALIIA